MASLYNIHFRTGCFCNSGACQKMLGISSGDVKRNLQVSTIFILITQLGLITNTYDNSKQYSLLLHTTELISIMVHKPFFNHEEFKCYYFLHIVFS